MDDFCIYELYIFRLGRHTVEILYAGQAIIGSPFFVDNYDPNKIKVLGTPNSSVGQRVEFESKWHL